MPRHGLWALLLLVAAPVAARAAPPSTAPPPVQAPPLPQPAATASALPPPALPPVSPRSGAPADTTTPPLSYVPPPGIPAKDPPALAAQTGVAGAAWRLPHYDNGVVLLSTPEPDGLPFRLVLNHVSQFKYSNTMAVHKTFTTHLGEEREVLRRNDIQLTRDVFYFSGYVFDRRLDFNILLYTSTATLSATAAGYVGWVFAKSFALRAGFFSLPSLRSMTGTYPYFPGTDRSMAVNYMRPGFTQGIWANGEVYPGVQYIAMIGNSLNTLDIGASRIDAHFAGAVSVWYDHNEFGKTWNDYEHHAKPSVRFGGAFTYAREDRLSDLENRTPENNSTFLSDGTLLFETGSLATGVTVTVADVYIAAADFGVKYRGLAFNVEFYERWLNRFSATGPIPIDAMNDWGFEASLGYFALPKKLETYARTSYIGGAFRNAIEGAVGIHFYPVRTRDVYLSTELIAIRNNPFGSVYYIYSAGQTGLLVPVQFLLRF